MRNDLNLELQLRLAEYVKAEYKASKLPDERFAAQAAEHLGFPISKANVTSVRKALKLEPNVLTGATGRAAIERVEEFEARLQELESAVAALQAQVKALQHYQKLHP